MSDLVHVKKAGEPTLTIHRDALAQHVKLGWVETDDAPAIEAKEPPPEKKDAPAEGKKDSKGK